MTTAAIILLTSIRQLLGVLLINKLLIPQSSGHLSLKMDFNRWIDAFLCMLQTQMFKLDLVKLVGLLLQLLE